MKDLKHKVHELIGYTAPELLAEKVFLFVNDQIDNEREACAVDLNNLARLSGKVGANDAVVTALNSAATALRARASDET